MTEEQLISSLLTTAEMGRRGEQFVLEYERKRLPENLAKHVLHLDYKEVALGYDVLSYNSKDSLVHDRYIEVKTYRGHQHFYWTENEIAAARHHKEHYYLYLVDADRIEEVGYDPQIIPYPALLIDNPELARKMGLPEMMVKPQQYICAAVAEEAIPDDWDKSMVLFGCYNNEKHLKWILDNKQYNVRARKPKSISIHGEVAIKDEQVRQAKYLVLYSIANSRIYSLYTIVGLPRLAYRTEMLHMQYPNPHADAYVLHGLGTKLTSFYIDTSALLRKLNHTSERKYGTPLYLTGEQLRKFMVNKKSSHPRQPVPIATGFTLPPNHDKPWTNVDEELLVQMFNKRVGFNEMAKHFGRTKKAVIMRLKKLGIIHT